MCDQLLPEAVLCCGHTWFGAIEERVYVSDSQNPWLAEPSEPKDAVVPAAVRSRELPRPTAPQPGVPTPDSADRLPLQKVNQPAALWWLGVHGGAGESTLAMTVKGSHAANHAWPIAHDGSTSNVVLVARSNANGLAAAQRAATEWASGSLPTIRLLGLVIVADSHGKLPKPLRDLAQVVSGGVPQVWQIPWVEAWRLGEPVVLDTAPKEVRALATAANAWIAPSV